MDGRALTSDDQKINVFGSNDYSYLKTVGEDDVEYKVLKETIKDD